MTSSTRYRLATGMKTSVVLLCAVLALRGRPPAEAQRRTQFLPVLTVKDAQQDDAINDLRENSDKSERTLQQRIDANTADVKQLREDVAGLAGENRTEFGSIALLGGGGMLLGRRRKRD